MKFGALDDFTEAYETAALWSSADDAGNPLDCGEYELAPETRAQFAEDCRAFFGAHENLFSGDNCPKYAHDTYGAVARAGHDFWLTRCGHGSGFWDGDWAEPAATTLTDAARSFGSADLYVGDDGLIYIF